VDKAGQHSYQLADRVQDECRNRLVRVADHEFRIGTDPLAAPTDGMRITVSSLKLDPVQAEAAPLSVENDEYFDGALLAVCIQYGNTYVVEGTAVMIGLGLALSAKHVFDDHRAAFDAGDAVGLCIGVRGDGTVAAWHVYSMATLPNGTDLQLLSLRLVSDMPTDGDFSIIPLTTRVPARGEHLTTVGFRFDDEPASTDSIENPVALSGLLYVSQGAAGQFSFPVHDSVLAPYPTIEVLSGTLGGMSGGAVIDVNGHIVGITSRGLETDDQQGPSLAAWWVPAYFWKPQLTWPSGFYDEEFTGVSDNLTVRIVGREHILVTENGRYDVTKWL
jgi:hypothetical protein